MTGPRLSVLVLASAASAAACATAATAGPDTSMTPMTTSLVSTTGTFVIGNTNQYTAISTTLPIKPDSAYLLLEAAYKKLEIPVTEDDGSRRSVGNDLLKVRRRLAGIPMQLVVDCGEKMGLANAETWDIEVNILSYVVDDGKGGAKVATRIQALGHDPLVSGRDMIPCSTKGELEVKIGNAVKLLAMTPVKKK